MSASKLARLLACSQPVIRLMERGRAHDRMTLDFLHRLANVLEVSPASLLVTDDDVAPVPSRDDVRIEAALQTSERPTTRDELARALGWELQRVERALDSLGSRLGGTGAMLQRSPRGRAAIRPRTEVVSRDELVRLEQARAFTRGLHVRPARLLRLVLAGEVGQQWERQARAPDRIARATLMRQDIVREDAGSGTEATEDARYSLLVDEPGFEFP